MSNIIRIKDEKHWKRLQRSKKWQGFDDLEPDCFPFYAMRDNPVVLLNTGSIKAFVNAAIKNGDLYIKPDELNGSQN